MGATFTPEQVERAAEALWFEASLVIKTYGWGSAPESSKRSYRAFAEKILSAAGAPERTPEFESREQELFKHQPVLSMSDGGVVGCQCMDRVFYRKTEDWGTHLAEVFDLLSAAGVPEELVHLRAGLKHVSGRMAEARATLQGYADRIDEHVFGELASELDDQWCDFETGMPLGAPEKVAPVVDEAALERLIMGRTATAAAREVAAYLWGESK